MKNPQKTKECWKKQTKTVELFTDVKPENTFDKQGDKGSTNLIKVFVLARPSSPMTTLVDSQFST